MDSFGYTSPYPFRTTHGFGVPTPEKSQDSRPVSRVRESTETAFRRFFVQCPPIVEASREGSIEKNCQDGWILRLIECLSGFTRHQRCES